MKVEVVKKPCTYILHIQEPLDTMQKLMTVFGELKLFVNGFEMYRYRNGDAMVIVKCQVEEEGVKKLKEKIEKISNVKTVELH